MWVLDLFAGTGSSTRAFEDAGDYVYRVELDTKHDADLHANVLDVTVEDVGTDWDFIWASPPCTTFSVAGFRWHWDAHTRCQRCNRVVIRQSGGTWGDCGGHKPSPGELTYIPMSDDAKLGKKLIIHTLDLINEISPKYWVMENPRGLLRKMPFMEGIDKHTVSYCQYGDTRMKPTDLFGVFPDGWTPRMCRNGAPCHEAAPRGSVTGGTQSISSVHLRSMVPYDLGKSLREAMTD